jgi:hypothetical protein
MNAAHIGLIHNDPTNPGPGWGLGGAFSRVDGGLVDALLPFLGPDAAAPFIAVEIRHVGAAAATDVPEGSAVGGRDLEYLFHLIGAPDPALFPEVLPAAGQAFLAGLATWIAPTTTPNWASAETLDTSWTPQTRDRIRAARASVDPTGMFPLS